jgi:hypothetical protein
VLSNKTEKELENIIIILLKPILRSMSFGRRHVMKLTRNNIIKGLQMNITFLNKFLKKSRPNEGISFGLLSSRTIIPIIHFPTLIPFKLSFAKYRINPGIITNNIIIIILLGLFSSIKFGPSAINTIETIKNVITKWSIMNAAIRLFLLDLRNLNSVFCSVIVVGFKIGANLYICATK